MTPRSAWLAVLASAALCVAFYARSLVIVEHAEMRIRSADDRARKAEAAYRESQWLAWEGQWNARSYELGVDQCVDDCAMFLRGCLDPTIGPEAVRSVR